MTAVRALLPELFRTYLSLPKDRSQGAPGQLLVHGHNRGATVGMPHLHVAPALAHLLETEPDESTNDGRAR